MTPTKNESLPELPNTEYRGGNDVYGKEFMLYTADQMRAYAEAALTREAPTEGVDYDDVYLLLDSARSNLGARRPDYDEDVANHWDRLTAAMESVKAVSLRQPESIHHPITPPAPQRQSSNEVAIVCDWKDADPFPRFIEAEVDGCSVSLEWRDREDGLMELIVPAHTQSDYPGCSGDPASCPENEGYGCCKPNPLRMAHGECRHSLWSPAGGYCLDCGYSPVGPDEESAIDAAVGLAKVVLRLPVELLGEIDHRAQQSGCVRNAYLRQLLAEHHTQPPHQDRGEEQPPGTVGSMTPKRAIFFLERFKREEKLLGPHEQWALDFAIAALTEAKQQGPGEGFVLVPRVPTEAMIEAGHAEYDKALIGNKRDVSAAFLRRWAAMLDAAPQVEAKRLAGEGADHA